MKDECQDDRGGFGAEVVLVREPIRPRRETWSGRTTSVDIVGFRNRFIWSKRSGAFDTPNCLLSVLWEPPTLAWRLQWRCPRPDIGVGVEHECIWSGKSIIWARVAEQQRGTHPDSYFTRTSIVESGRNARWRSNRLLTSDASGERERVN